MTLEIFGFRALWSPYFFLFLLFAAVCYYLVTFQYRHKFSGSEPLTKRQAICFTAGIILVYIIKGSPLDLLGHLMFYVHMIQMAFLYLIIPPLFIFGIPPWIWRKVIKYRYVRKPFRLLTKPVPAILLFNGVFSLYHIPFIFDAVKTNFWLHAVHTIFLFLLALFMWWPLLNEVEEEAKLSGLKKMFYLFADGVLLTPACALIIFSDVPLYSTFSVPDIWLQALQLCVPDSMIASLDLSGPEMFHSLSLLHDQQLGGILMKLIQEVVYGSVLYQAFMKWYREEQGGTKNAPVDIDLTK